MKLWKVALICAVGLTLLWMLSPTKSFQTFAKEGVVEIGYMGPGGPVSGPMDDAVKAFERLSEEAHKKDPSKPIYRVISGQNASQDQVADPTRFLLSVAGGMPPDVIFFDRYAVTEWAARGAFEPLDKYIQRDKEQKVPDSIDPASYFPSAWGEGVYTDPLTGKQAVYGIPNGIDDRGLFYNKDLLKRAGYDGPPKTWEELEEMSVKLTEKDPDTGNIKRMGFIPNWGNSFLYIYGWMNGGEFMSADGKTCTLNDPKIVGALDWVTRIYDRLGGATQVNAFQSGFAGGDMDPFLIGKIAMKIDGYWILNTLAQFGKFLNWGVAPPPVPRAELAKGKKFTSWVGGWCYAIPSTAKNKDAAWELIRFLSSLKGVEVQTESERLNAASQGRVYIPVQHPCLKINEWMTKKYVLDNPTTDPKIREGVIMMNQMLPASRFRPVTAVGQLLWNQQETALGNGVFHKMTSKQALDEGTMLVQRQLDEILHPQKGSVINWGFFIWLYVGLLALIAGAIYFWDTRLGLRQRIARRLTGLGGGKLAHWGGDVETHSSYSRGQWKDGWLTALPWLAGFVFFTGGPILFSVIISFARYDILNPAQFIGLANYKWMFANDPLFWKSLWNTCYMTLGIPLGMCLSLGIAMLLNLKVKGVAVWRTFFYVPSIIPTMATIILWIWVFNPQGGLLNSVMRSFGLPGLNWLQDEHSSKPSLILMGLWGAGGGMLVWLAGLKGISEVYYEAASLDGANAWQQFRHVTLPMLSPYILFNLIMGLIGTFQIFDQAFIMTKGGPVQSTSFYVFHLFNNAFRYMQMGYASAMAWFLFMIVFILTILNLRLSGRWVHYEGD